MFCLFSALKRRWWNSLNLVNSSIWQIESSQSLGPQRAMTRGPGMEGGILGWDMMGTKFHFLMHKAGRHCFFLLPEIAADLLCLGPAPDLSWWAVPSTDLLTPRSQRQCSLEVSFSTIEKEILNVVECLVSFTVKHVKKLLLCLCD